MKRLEILTKKFNLNPNIIKYFKEDRCYYSYLTGGGLIGSIDTIQYDSRYVKVVKDFEKRTNSLVYHVIETGDMISLLFVGDYKEDWCMEKLENDEYISSYVHNFNMEALYSEGYAEYGDIWLEGFQGALIRIW